jgi:glycosyl transferase, family 25
MKTFLISLERQVERRQRLTRDLDSVKLDYEVFDAVDGYKLGEEEVERICHPDVLNKYKSFFTKGLIGACLSHFSIYQEIIKRGLPYAFIVEDDAKLPMNILTILNEIEKHLYTNELVLLYYQSAGQTEISTSDTTNLLDNYSLMYPIRANVNGAGAYIITKAACEALVKLIMPVHVGPDDWEYFSNNGIEHVRVLYPRVVKTYDFRSTISDASNFSKNKGLIKFLNFIEKNKVFPVYQILALRRNIYKNRIYNNFKLVEKQSGILKK